MTTMALKSGWRGVVAIARGDGANTSLAARLMHAFSWQMAASLVGRVGTFAIAIFQARILGKAGYGELGMVLSTLTLFGLFANAAGGDTCTKFIAEHKQQRPERAERIVALSLTASMIACALALLAILVWSHSLADWALHAPAVAPMLRLAGVAVGFQCLSGLASGILFGLKEFRMEGILRLVQIAVWLPLTVWLSPGWGVYGAMVAYTASHGVGFLALLVAAVRVCRREGFRPRFEGMWGEAGVLAHFSLPTLLNAGLAVPTAAICNALLAREPGGYAALGGYVAASQLRAIALQLPILIQGIVWPTLAELRSAGEMGQFGRLFQNTLELLWALGLLVALPVILFGPLIMGIFGRTFAADQQLLSLVMMGASLFLLSNSIGTALLVAGRTWSTVLASAAYGSASIVCAAALVPTYGAKGLAAAFVIGTLVQALVLLSRLRTTLPELHRWANFGLVALSGILCLVLQILPQGTSSGALFLRLIALAVGMALVWRFGLNRPLGQLLRSFSPSYSRMTNHA
jgi:O-antigen/teichoic acid export membrane protein